MKTGKLCVRRLDHPGSCQSERSQRIWFADRRKWWREFLDGYKTLFGCENCGFQSDRGGYFDLDHEDRSNGRNTPVTVMCRRLNPKRKDHMKRVLAELGACRVLCVACHRDKTGNDLAGDWPGITDPGSQLPVSMKDESKERVWLDRLRPFELFLKTGGDIYAFHMQIGRLTVTLDRAEQEGDPDVCFP